MSKWEMLHDYKIIYPDANQRIKSDAFNRVATRVTRTQQKSMRALDYNITDLLYEPYDLIKGIIEDLSTADNDSSQQLLKDIDLVYTTIQHIHPTLIGTTNLAPHNLRFGIGNITERAIIDVC